MDRRAGRRLGLRVDLGRFRFRRHLPAGGRCSAARRSWCCARVPIVAKWVLIGRWKPQQIRIWSLGYVRFWLVKTLVRSNPLALLAAGSPLYVLYLRALGAKIGRGAAIFSHQVPGLHRPAHHRRGHGDPQRRLPAGLPGPVGLDPDRPGHHRPGRVHRREDRARHRHLDGRRGAARPRLRAAQRPGGPRRRAVARLPGSAHRAELPDGGSGSLRHGCAGPGSPPLTLLCVFFLYLPLAEGGVYLLLTQLPALGHAAGSGHGRRSRQPEPLHRRAGHLAGARSSACCSAGLLFVITVPRVLNLFIKPGRSIRCTASTTGSTGRSPG